MQDRSLFHPLCFFPFRVWVSWVARILRVFGTLAMPVCAVILRPPPFFCLCAGTTPSFHTSLKTVLEQSEKSWEKSFHADSRLQGHINNPATGCQRTNFNHQFRVRPCRKRNATRESVAQDTALQYKTSVFAARRSHALKKKEMSENPLTVRHFSAGRPVDSLDH